MMTLCSQLFGQLTLEPTLYEAVLQNLLFLSGVVFVMYVSQKLLDAVFDRHFMRLYKTASSKARAMNKKRYDTLAITFRRLASVAIWIAASLVVLSHYGINYAALLTGAGAISIVFGIAGKDIIMDLYVGVTALVEDQYRVGDVIVVDQDHAGTVEDITLRTVKLRDIDGNVHIVPHSMARAIINKTFDYSNVNVEVRVAYASDLERVKQLINDVGAELAHDEQWAKKFLAPITYNTLLQYDKTQVTLRAQGKVKSGQQWAVDSEYRQRLMAKLDQNGIELAPSQNVVRTITDPKDSAPKPKQ